MSRLRSTRGRTIAAVLAAALALTAATTSSAADEEATIITLGPGVRAQALTVAPDGALWFAGGGSVGIAEGWVGRVTSSGAVREFPLHTHEPARAIVAGPDGNLWFTETGAGKLGRIAAGGEIATFALPDSKSAPGGIAAGPDGNLWFTEEAASMIGRVTPSGEITEFDLAAGRRPTGIIAGPDRSLWFTERGGNAIGRITTSGDVVEYPLPGPKRRPLAIAAGPDGNLWFSEEGANRIGRITTAGEIAEFPVPALSGTGAITAGPDGDVWFTAYPRFGSISPSGEVTRLSCINHRCRLPALSLATDSEGAVWIGAGTEYPAYGGGQSSINADLLAGSIARVSPQPRALTLVSGPAPARGRQTSVHLRCEAAAGCEGTLALARLRPVSEIFLARQHYVLAGGESRRVPLHLNRRAADLLSRRGTLSAWALAGARGDLDATRLVTLRRAGGHR